MTPDEPGGAGEEDFSMNYDLDRSTTVTDLARGYERLAQLRAQGLEQNPWLAKIDRLTAERDGARDLAAHLGEELARLRAGIQGDIDSQRLLGFHFVPSPALTGHLEAEQAEGQQ